MAILERDTTVIATLYNSSLPTPVMTVRLDLIFECFLKSFLMYTISALAKFIP